MRCVQLWVKRILVYAGPTNLEQSFTCSLKGWVTTGQPWSEAALNLEKVPSVPIPREVHKVTTRTPECYHALMDGCSLGYQYCWALLKSHGMRIQVHLSCHELFPKRGPRPSSWWLHNVDRRELHLSHIIYRLASLKSSWPIVVNPSRGQHCITYRPSIR